MVELVSEPVIIHAMLRSLWADDARRRGFDEATIGRLVFARWRLSRDLPSLDHQAGKRVIHGKVRQAE